MQAAYLTPQIMKRWLQIRQPDSHKGDYGRALLVAGSRGMMGAALLSSRACMRGGVGLLTVRVPSCGYDIMQLGLPEAKCECDENPSHHTKIQVPTDTEVLGIGPGLGQDAETQEALHQLLLQNACKYDSGQSPLPMVLDADALNILAQHTDWLELLPTDTILTPHPGEMKRLGMSPKELSNRYSLVVVLKGHVTHIFFPDDECYIHDAHGNAGMAVGGSGDVLTGLILSLLAQHYPPVIAACLGVWLHAFAADLALADHQSMESLLPSDIIAHLGEAFNHTSAMSL